MDQSSKFTIDLVQIEKHVSGKYCFITNNGNCIDSAKKDDDDNIKGNIKDGEAKIQFESTFGRDGSANKKYLKK